MINNYISQIVTMNILADSVSIIDDKGIIRYFRIYNDRYLPYYSKDVVGKHFMDVFTGINPDESTVLKALKGETFHNGLAHYIDKDGNPSDVIESIYPIKLRNQVVGVVCVANTLWDGERIVELTPIDLRVEEADIDRIVGSSSVMQYLKMQIRDLSNTDANVLIYGETGSGKDLVAKALHYASKRKSAPFFSQNCAAIPNQLLESIFFGTKKGAYTGAENRPGILAQANGGTLFLDEINSLAMPIQAKLLKAIEEKKFRPLGDTEEKEAEFRVLAATNEEPFSCIRKKKLREDLFFRLGTVILEIPPLRNRKEDIAELVNHFVKENNAQREIQITDITDEALDTLMAYNWPGNVRELRNVVESSMIFAKDGVIRKANLPAYIFKTFDENSNSMRQTNSSDFRYDLKPERVPAKLSLRKASAPLREPIVSCDELLGKSLAEVEKEIIRLHLADSGNHTEVAKRLGISRQTLISKIKKYGL